MNPQAPEHGQTEPSKNGAAVLVIDDTPAIRTLISRILRAEGYSVSCVEGGAQALAVVKTETFIPQIALIDLTMPEQNGLDVANALQTHLPNLRAGIMSGFDRDDTLRAYGLNTDELAFLAKPFSRNQLLSFVDELSL